VKFVAKVASTDGPLARASVDIVAPEGGSITVIGRGTVERGALAADADPRAIWGIWIDRRPIIAFPASIDGEAVDLGEIVMLADGMEWPAFHARDGRVYGVPRAAQTVSRAPSEPAPAPGPRPPIPREPVPTLRSRMTFGEVLGSTARQLKQATIDTSDFRLAGATITLKGVPSATDEALSLEFPTAEMVTSGVGLSEISFAIRPAQESAAPEQPSTPASRVPDVVGYTREFAVRKIAAAGFVAEVNYEMTSDSSLAGKVIRHVPPGGNTLAPGGLIRVYVGKQ